MKLSLAVSGYPPDVDGIGDYTYWLARALSELPNAVKPVVVYARKGRHESAENVVVRPFFDFAKPDSFGDLLPLIREDAPDWLILQYNPFGWGPRGWCPSIPLTLRKIKEQRRAPRIAVMFHETTVPKWPWRFAIMYAWQRPILRRVAQMADAIFVSTKRWIPELASAGAKAPAAVVPAGSNIPRSNMTKAEARMRLGIDADCLVLAVFGGAHPSRQLDWIAEAARAVNQRTRGTLVLHVGPEGDLIAKAAGEIPFKSLGIQPAKDVSGALRAADCLLSPFIDGVSTRRTSAIAALHNGIPVATTARHWTDDWFLNVGSDVVLARAFADESEFGAAVARWLRPLQPNQMEAVQRAHDSFFAWPRIALGIRDGILLS